jgi:hypothetical protein
MVFRLSDRTDQEPNYYTTPKSREMSRSIEEDVLNFRGSAVEASDFEFKG